MSKLPIHVDIDLSSKCNLRCRFCHLSYFTPKEVTELDIDNFNKLEPLLGKVKSVTLFSKYETLTCKDFIPIFKKISSYDVETYFSTNGLLLSDEVIDVLVGNLKYLTISITGFTNKTYKENMRANKFDEIKEIIGKINALKKARNTRYPILRISTVALLDVIHELRMAVDFVKKYEVEEGLQVTSFKAFTDELVDLIPLKNDQYFTDTTNDAIAYAKEQGVKMVLQSGSIIENQEGTKQLGHRNCNMPWYRMSIQPNGDVYPCPVSSTPVGNFFENDIMDIWSSEEMEKFRRGVNDLDNMNEDCANCTHCRHRSTTNPNVNDYSQKENYIGEMKRKKRRA